ncbi:hypothetical protein CDD80_1659 [Ophiocordyceps camponoti-rufipedis]|uniref:1,3-beta-glucanosyltransferase n=1 Tax=Ophiocordyceps camponoti-rufipedis TaxID=2004952 RepID=A0A2C5YDX0_9HYPO|nr:hypothetical protein CDD80_1659 [Ophiocordyceps camponoti-rufipedis]
MFMPVAAALAALGASLVAAVPSLEIRGTDLVNPATGAKFHIAGMAYQPGGSSGYNPQAGKDPLSTPDNCLRDAALMQILGVNTIRVYNLDPNANHDECASIFNAAGIYMIIDVNSPLVGESMTSYQPWTSYYAAYLNHTFAVIEAFAGYPNTLIFFSGNEIINDLSSAKEVPPYLRAVTRDLKNYIKNNVQRKIPVGYSAADVRDVLWDTWNYMQCSGEDEASRADVFALNSYSWCGPQATYESSTFNALTEGFQKSSIPVFFSEYGCNQPAPRYWNETTAIYNQMGHVFSGGVVYEWTQGSNEYGLVKLDGDGVRILSDYDRLKSQWANLDWKSIQSQPAAGQAPPAPSCQEGLIKEVGFKNNFTLPAVPPGAQQLIDHGINPKPSGKLVSVSDFTVKATVKDASGNPVSGLKVQPLGQDEFNWAGRNSAGTGRAGGGGDNNDTNSDKGDEGGQDKDGNKGGKDKEDAGVSVRPTMVWAAAVALMAIIMG